MGGKLDIDLRVVAIAEDQDGVISRAQLLAVGVGAKAIEHRARRGALHRLHRGVYAVGHRRLGPRGRWWAAVLACGSGAALSHASAAAAWGIRRSDGALVDVMVPTHAGRSRRAGIRLHRTVRPETTTLDGLPITTVQRTLADLAATFRDPAVVRRALHQAEVLGLIDPREEHPRTRSVLEDAFLDLCAKARLPAPEVNQHVGGFEVDFLWRAQRVIAETDGREHHGTRVAFEQDRARDAQLTVAGYTVVRFTYNQVHRRRRETAATLRALLSR